MATTKTTKEKVVKAKVVKAPKAEKAAAAKPAKVETGRYFEAIGRRKTASARVRITPSTKDSIIVNDKSLADYFQTENMQNIVLDAKKASGITQNFSITVKVYGGGIHAQSEAVRHGISRAIVVYDGNLRGTLKKAGMLKRDSRQVERKKPGLKKARKAPTWSKR
jgi:small subunit ribosomal protein S9